MNDIIAHTLSAYTSSFDLATKTNEASKHTSVFINTSPVVNEEPTLLALSTAPINNVSSTLSPTNKRRGRTSPAPTVRLPLKKALSVRWKDQTEGENAYIDADVPLSEKENLNDDDDDLREINTSKNIKPKKRSPSPPHLDMKEYEHRMKKIKLSIGEACKMELKLLNQAKNVRDKRTRMVERLKHMRRKAQRFTVLNAQKDHSCIATSYDAMDVVTLTVSEGNVITDNDDDDFVLPPVFHEKPVKKHLSNYVDMTQ